MNQVLKKSLKNSISYVVNNSRVQVELIEILKEKKNSNVYNIIEIPPPYCSVCNKFLTNFNCTNVIQPKNCPFNK